jgi:hypothetical protein
MRPLLTLHHGLEATGRAIGQVTRLVLVVILFAVTLIAWSATIPAAMWLAAVFVGIVAPTPISWPENPGLPVVFVLVFFPLASVFMAFIGFYVTPHVEPQMGKAMNALLNLDINAGHFEADVSFALHEQCGRLTRQCGQRVTVQQVLTEALADWFVKRGATLTDGLKAAYSPEKYYIRECDLCGPKRLMTPKEITDEMIPLTSEDLATRLLRAGEA